MVRRETVTSSVPPILGRAKKLPPVSTQYKFQIHKSDKFLYLDMKITWSL